MFSTDMSGSFLPNTRRCTWNSSDSSQRRQTAGDVAPALSTAKGQVLTEGIFVFLLGSFVPDDRFGAAAFVFF